MANNIVLCCQTCNKIKSTMSVPEFKKEVISFINAMKERVNIMEDQEKEAYLYGGEMSAEYAMSINKTDLTALSGEEWLTFCECMCKNYHSKYIQLTNRT